MDSSPFVGYVDVVVERVAADFSTGVDTLVVDTTVVVGKSTIYMVVIAEMVIDMEQT